MPRRTARRSYWAAGGGASPHWVLLAGWVLFAVNNTGNNTRKGQISRDRETKTPGTTRTRGNNEEGRREGAPGSFFVVVAHRSRVVAG